MSKTFKFLALPSVMGNRSIMIIARIPMSTMTAWRNIIEILFIAS
jgi:hypothetical protein